jgi:hypothetical protein
MTLTQEDLKTLTSPFPKDRLGIKVQSTSKDKTKAMLICYLSHTDVYARLEEVDPAWSCEVRREWNETMQGWGDKTEKVFFCDMQLTVKGVTRENVGEGGDPKSAYSDALKRASMLFGVGRYLYDSEQVWVPYNEQTDKFRTWTYEDYTNALRRGQTPVPISDAVEKAKAAAVASGKTRITPDRTTQVKTMADRGRDDLNAQIMKLYRPFLTAFPTVQIAELLMEKFGKAETRLMSLEELASLVLYFEEQLASVQPKPAA